MTTWWWRNVRWPWRRVSVPGCHAVRAWCRKDLHSICVCRHGTSQVRAADCPSSWTGTIARWRHRHAGESLQCWRHTGNSLVADVTQGWPYNDIRLQQHVRHAPDDLTHHQTFTTRPSSATAERSRDTCCMVLLAEMCRDDDLRRWVIIWG